MAKIVQNTRMLREPNGRRPQRLKHRFNDRKWFDVLTINGLFNVTGTLHTVAEDRSDYVSETVTIEGAAELRHWQTVRGTPPLPGEGPNRKGTEGAKSTNSNSNGGNMPKASESGNVGAELVSILERIGGRDERVDQLAAKIEDLEKAVANAKPKVIEIRTESSTYHAEGIQHKSFEDLARLVNVRDPSGNRLNAYLFGPAGTGKSSAAKEIAKALGLDFYAVGALQDRYELSGFRGADGTVAETAFRKIWANGGVILLDEVDRAAPDAVMWLNVALANGLAAFPDGTVKRHSDTIVVGTGNTNMTGATEHYNTAKPQDSSFADRFVAIDWPIDEALEEALCGGNTKWLARVRQIRNKVAERGIFGVEVTPRATIYGASLLAAGFEWKRVEDMVLFARLTNEQREAVR